MMFQIFNAPKSRASADHVTICWWLHQWNPPIFGCEYGSIPIDTFLVRWTSIYQLFWGSPGTRVLTHPHVIPIFHLVFLLETFDPRCQAIPLWVHGSYVAEFCNPFVPAAGALDAVDRDGTGTVCHLFLGKNQIVDVLFRIIYCGSIIILWLSDRYGSILLWDNNNILIIIMIIWNIYILMIKNMIIYMIS